MAGDIQFILNNEEMQIHEPQGLLVLDYLRHRRRLTGTKEGCKEGDCGACGVLVGTLAGAGQKATVSYQPVTACLMPVGELHGKHLVTVEGLNMEHLSIVQESIVEEGASQCGFCTAGIVVSLSGMLLNKGPEIQSDDVQYALSGHLCRCTGYASLLRAGERVISAAATLSGDNHTDALVNADILPKYFRGIAGRLQKIAPLASRNGKNGRAMPKNLIAGGTDIYVQRGEELPESSVGILNNFPEMGTISSDNDFVRVGALTTFEAFAAHPAVQKVLPDIGKYMFLIASWQIRNRATIGGNIINASPIGDMTNLLLALDTILVLREGKNERRIAMKDFFTGYKQLAKKPTEILSDILIPLPPANTMIHWEKVSKRRCLDIASVVSGCKLTMAGEKIEAVNLTMGGVAPIPFLMQKTAAFLRGKTISSAMLQEALAIAQQEISPISDIRGSIEYKRLLVRQLMIAHFMTFFPETVSMEALLS